jgi:hypothetical protein
MQSNNNTKTKEQKKGYEKIDEKIDRLQKQNEAESAALKKLLEGLEKISNPEPQPENNKSKKRK